MKKKQSTKYTNQTHEQGSWIGLLRGSVTYPPAMLRTLSQPSPKGRGIAGGTDLKTNAGGADLRHVFEARRRRHQREDFTSRRIAGFVSEQIDVTERLDGTC